MNILLVEDEPELARHVKRALTQAGHAVEARGDGPAGSKALESSHFDLLVLDVNLPGYDGYELLRRIPKAMVRPRVLMLTAKSEIADRVTGLKAGADDYLTKPFAMEELLARVEALGRRPGAVERTDVFVARDIRLDLVNRKVSRGGQAVELSPREIDVLAIFMREPDRVFTRDEICERIWQREHEYDTRTVEIFIMRLRKKLGSSEESPLIETIRGVGYVLRSRA